MNFSEIVQRIGNPIVVEFKNHHKGSMITVTFEVKGKDMNYCKKLLSYGEITSRYKSGIESAKFLVFKFISDNTLINDILDILQTRSVGRSNKSLSK